MQALHLFAVPPRVRLQRRHLSFQAVSLCFCYCCCCGRLGLEAHYLGVGRQHHEPLHAVLRRPHRLGTQPAGGGHRQHCAVELLFTEFVSHKATQSCVLVQQRRLFVQVQPNQLHQVCRHSTGQRARVRERWVVASWALCGRRVATGVSHLPGHRSAASWRR